MIKLQKVKKLDEEISFSDAIRLVVRIKEKKMTMVSLKAEATDGLISLIRDKLGWIDVSDKNSKIEITAKVREYIIEYHAMIVLENISSRMAVGSGKNGMTKFELTNNAPAGVAEFLKKNKLIFFTDTGLGYPDDKIVHATDKGAEELKEYFKKEE